MEWGSGGGSGWREEQDREGLGVYKLSYSVWGSQR